MLWASFDVKFFNDNSTEWKIDAVKKYAKKLKNEEIEHSPLPPTEKEKQKKLSKQWIDETTRGFEEELKREGRME